MLVYTLNRVKQSTNPTNRTPQIFYPIPTMKILTNSTLNYISVAVNSIHKMPRKVEPMDLVVVVPGTWAQRTGVGGKSWKIGSRGRSWKRPRR